MTNDRFSCNLCHKFFHARLNLKQHMRRHQFELRYFCDFCSKQFYVKSRLERHIINRHNFKMYYSCDLCPKKCVIKSRLERHVVAHHRKFYCDVCGMHFKNPIRLATHFNQHEELVPCPFCDVKVKAKSLQTHKYYHIYRKSKKTACPICGFMADYCYLKKHIRTHESFSCRKCKARFNSLAELRT